MQGIRTLKNQLILIILPVLFLSSSFAAARDADQIYIQQPNDLEDIINSTQISWFMKDADQAKIPFQIDLFQLACPNNGDYYGTITDDANAVTKDPETNIFTYKWNTLAVLKNKASIADGQYCLRICAVFVRDRNYYYSLCDTKSISIVNINKAPKILSKPDKLNYKIGEDFVYQVNAIDTDNDALVYKLIDAPSFININSATGLLKSNAKLQTAGNFIIRIHIEDGNGGIAEDVFTITVAQKNSDYALVITAPKDKQIIKDTTIKVDWTITSGADIEVYTLSYSKDAIKWTKVASFPGDLDSIEWDVNDIASGDYFIMLEAELKSGEIVSTTSGKFSLDKSSAAIPLIINLRPADGVVLNNKRPLIAADYSAADGGSIDKDQTTIALDDNILNDCTKTDNTILCQQSSDLSAGKHKVNLIVNTVDDTSNQKEWFFEISATTDNTSTTGIDSDMLKQVALILCVGGLLIVAILILVLMIRRIFKKREIIVEPLPMEYAPASTTDSYIIGNNDYSQYQTPAEVVIQPQPQPQTDVVYAQPVINETTQMPATYADDEIPDWLKDTNTSAPVMPDSTSSSHKFNSNTFEDKASMDEISKPHE